MRSFKDFFGNVFGTFGEDRLPEPDKLPARRQSAGRQTLQQNNGMSYKKGDFIGRKYAVEAVLGTGGFGVVYLVYSNDTHRVYALKTLRDDLLGDSQATKRFRKEAQVWVDLGRHPYLVQAHLVDELDGILFVGLEYIAPNELGLNSLEGYLQCRPPDLAQSLRWAIQICHGMENAYSKGVRCHRDIKPANILIAQDKTVKVSDFGLAGVLRKSGSSEINVNIRHGRLGLSGQTMDGVGFGTPTHMPPEQFADAASCGEGSDIYAFGVVLYQMASGGRPPFLAPLPRDNSPAEISRFWWAMHSLHSRAEVPPLPSPLFPIIRGCLEKKRGRRYPSFKVLRAELESLLLDRTGEVVRPPDLEEWKASEWCERGTSLYHLGRWDEALQCYEKAIEIDEAIRRSGKAFLPDPRPARAWIGKALSLRELGRFEGAVQSCDKAIQADRWGSDPWVNKGCILHQLGRIEEALGCYDKALEIDPECAAGWIAKADSLRCLGRREEAARCAQKGGPPMEKSITPADLMQRLETILDEIHRDGVVYIVGADASSSFVLGPERVCGKVLGLIDEEYGWPVPIQIGGVADIEDIAPGGRRHPFICRDNICLAVGIQRSEYESIMYKSRSVGP